jgi:hypothetical protein
MEFSFDHTLFACFVLPGANDFMDCGMPAPSPEYLARSNKFAKYVNSSSQSVKPCSMTNRGLEIELSLCPPQRRTEYRLAILNCVIDEFQSKNIAILLAPAVYTWLISAGELYHMKVTI